MINWKDISGLHVIKKLEQIVGRWFGVDLFFTNEHLQIQTALFDKGHEFHGLFMKMQMHLPHGHEYLAQDIENITEALAASASTDKVHVYDSFFGHIKGAVCPIITDGEVLGYVFAYPFLDSSISNEATAELTKKVVECGADERDAQMSIGQLKKLGVMDREYLKELMSLASEEIVTYYHEICKREERISELNSEVGSRYRYHSMIGKSKQMQQIYALLSKIANSESTILIQGENGTGKELVAKAIHYNSPRKDFVFLAKNCSAFNDNLLDSELFGHVKGAFTGAIKDKKGLFEAANGGTLFLDEIGDTSMAMQVKLLRVLQEGTFLPVGSTTPKKVNVRVLAATNRDLKEMIKRGEFREDLYYRINVINVHLPALRERKEDIALLVEHFIAQRCSEMGHATKIVSKKCMEKLLDYPWPGNVRELENEIERMTVLSGNEKNLTPDLLSPKISEYGEAPASVQGIRTTGSLKDALEELEALMIKTGLKRCNFNKSKLAKELGISRAGLIMKVEKYGLDKRKKMAVGAEHEDFADDDAHEHDEHDDDHAENE